ncbi:sulfurtransferase-like selenium metabolism protein YedF [Campylobacter sp. TTU-622]|uniref:sulfurtransferase-like selenium metabolism protein YedF n=1 Tax=Campylobacter sp. TTU-622 TaxID=2800583 RepID=UPI0019054F6A|nr:sulfurtransferase-like selenium metabolism protein YedF [Campylobacter sp. TTU-622]MBK1973068.1 sulfurtransferase-like selenium metabolism protein YedF [Campylobacter sp. TTU-622]
MKIDCRNLACPEPVVKTKNALENLSEGEILEILVNSPISKNNVLKFLTSLHLDASFEECENEICIKVYKRNISLNHINNDEYSVLFLKADKIGAGELGENLLVGFLANLKNINHIPNKIICVNESVLINTNENHKAYKAMKELENLGVEIISCGACLEFFNKTKELKIGNIGNAYEILNELFGKAKIITL